MADTDRQIKARDERRAAAMRKRAAESMLAAHKCHVVIAGAALRNAQDECRLADEEWNKANHEAAGLA